VLEQIPIDPALGVILGTVGILLLTAVASFVLVRNETRTVDPNDVLR
jgi:hypothetical protein